MLPETFPDQKLLPGLQVSQSHVDALSPTAKAGLPIRRVRVTMPLGLLYWRRHFRLIPLRPQLSHHEGSVMICRLGLRPYYLDPLVTYSSVIASAGVALSAARQLATTLGPYGPKIGMFALWSAKFSDCFHHSLRIKLTIQPSPGSACGNLPLRRILFH